MNKNKIKKALECCYAVGCYETKCSVCPYCRRCNILPKDALKIITEQEKENEQLMRELKQASKELAEEQEACVECELKQSWELFARDKEIDRLRAEKKNVVKEFAKKLRARITKFAGLQDLSVGFFNDIVSDLLKGYEK